MFLFLFILGKTIFKMFLDKKNKSPVRKFVKKNDYFLSVDPDFSHIFNCVNSYPLDPDPQSC